MEWKQLLNGDRIRSYSKSTTSQDIRTEFEKDYHRIISSASFRRLQDKTQVFPLDKSDYIRTRLTHSLEVSSFARSLGQSVGAAIIENNLDPDFCFQQKEDICNILQCAGLIHDIGNPPFGHFGESAIQDWCKENFQNKKFGEKTIEETLLPQQLNDFYHFEGNTQALRVVTKLHFLVDENGMNLTKALLGTIIKYPVSSLQIKSIPGDIKCKKMGYFYADKTAFEDIQESLGTNGCRHPLTFLLEAADDIAYRTADIEDAIKKGCISYDQLIMELEDRVNSEENKGLYEKLLEILKNKYEKAINNKYEEPDIYAVQNWVVYVQGKVLHCVTDSFIENYEDIMAGTFKKDLFEETEAEEIMKALGEIAFKYAFTSKQIFKLEIAADAMFKFLLGRFMNAAIYFDSAYKDRLNNVDVKIMSIISKDYLRIYHKLADCQSEEERLYLRLLLVTDYICGMTDSFAKNLYQELNGIQ